MPWGLLCLVFQDGGTLLFLSTGSLAQLMEMVFVMSGVPYSDFSTELSQVRHTASFADVPLLGVDSLVIPLQDWWTFAAWFHLPCLVCGDLSWA